MGATGEGLLLLRAVRALCQPFIAVRYVRMTIHAAGEHSNVTFSKDFPKSEVLSPEVLRTRVLKPPDEGTLLLGEILGNITFKCSPAARVGV